MSQHNTSSNGIKSSESKQTGMQSISDLVFDPKMFSSILTGSTKAATKESTPISTQHEDSPKSDVKPPPKTSLADLVLNNVTYDAILASSAKGLGLDSDAENHTSHADLYAPPNTPAGSSTSYGSFGDAGATLLKSEK